MCARLACMFVCVCICVCLCGCACVGVCECVRAYEWFVQVGVDWNIVCIGMSWICMDLYEYVHVCGSNWPNVWM